jgi:hypothetical protein
MEQQDESHPWRAEAEARAYESQIDEATWSNDMEVIFGLVQVQFYSTGSSHGFPLNIRLICNNLLLKFLIQDQTCEPGECSA